MAPHCSMSELALVRKWQSHGRTSSEMRELHKADRIGRRIQPVCFSAFKKLLNGTTHQGGAETRGRKHKLGPRAVRALDDKRRQLVESTKGEIEIAWAEIIKKARVTQVHATTARRSLECAGISVASRRPREKPQRSQGHVLARFEKCGRWRYLRNNFFSDEADMIMDNKRFEAPTTGDARGWKAKSKVRHQVRTSSEGYDSCSCHDGSDLLCVSKLQDATTGYPEDLCHIYFIQK